MQHKITALGRPISIGYLTNKIVVILFFVTLIFTLGVYTFRGEPFSLALVSAFSSAGVIFLSWAIGRELDPANDWSAFVALPFIYVAFFTVGQPSLLTLFFTILCCRLLNRTCGLQPFKSDALLLFVMAIFLYFSNFYFALPYLIMVFVIDALVKPAHRFQFISALVGSGGYLIMLLAFSPEFALFMPETVTVNFPAAAASIILLSVLFVSYITRHVRVLDDLNRAELNNQRVTAARFLTAAWVAIEILTGGAIILLQIYPLVIVFGGIFLYHLTCTLICKSGPKKPRL